MPRSARTHHAAFGQNLAHLDDRGGVLAARASDARIAIAIAVAFARHHDAPVRQLVHRAERQPTAPVEEPALAVSQLLPAARCVVKHAAVKLDVVAAGHDLERIKLQVLHRPQRLFGPFEPPPTPSRPQALLAQDKAPRDLQVDRQHGILSSRRSATILL